MAKNIFLYDYIIAELNDDNAKKNLFLHLKNLYSEGNTIFIVEGNSADYEDCHDYINIVSVGEVESVIDNSDNPSVFVSCEESVFKVSQKTKSLFITPLWTEIIDNNPKTYGVKAATPKQMYQIIKHSNNNNYWHTKNELEDGTMLFTLLDAKFRYFSTSTNEGKMIDNFLSILHGDERNNFFTVLKYDLLSALSNKCEFFDNIDIWTVIPKSNKTLDCKMMELKKNIDVNTGLAEYDDYIDDNLILRHKEKQLSHEIPVMTRYNEGVNINLQTLMLNPKFKDRVKGATICVLDDFINHGYSFEAARNLLKAAGAKQVILLSLGLYQNDYSYEEYKLSGDLFSENFTIDDNAVKRHMQALRFKINFQAKIEVETLFSVFN